MLNNNTFCSFMGSVIFYHLWWFCFRELGNSYFYLNPTSLLSVCGLTGISRNAHCIVELKLQLYLLSLRKSEPLGDNDQIPLSLISLISQSSGSLTPDVSMKVFPCPNAGSGHSHLSLNFHSSSHDHLYWPIWCLSRKTPIRSLLQVRLQSEIPSKTCINFPDNFCGFGVFLCFPGTSTLGCYTLQFGEVLNSSTKEVTEQRRLTVLSEEANTHFLDNALKG